MRIISEKDWSKHPTSYFAVKVTKENSFVIESLLFGSKNSHKRLYDKDGKIVGYSIESCSKFGNIALYYDRMKNPEQRDWWLVKNPDGTIHFVYDEYGMPIGYKKYRKEINAWTTD